MDIFIPKNLSIGAVVENIAIPSLSDTDFARIYALFLDRSVVIFKHANIDQEEHIRFSRRFGRLERTLSKRTSRPEISLLSNVNKDGDVAKTDDTLGLFLKGNRAWHSDSSFKVVGAKASMLRALEVPSEGGDTEWADMKAAWLALDEKTQESLEDLVAVHSYGYSQGLIGGIALLKASELEDLPPVQHPIVRVHPETGEKSLYIGRHISHILGMSEEKSQELISELTEAACQSPRIFRHQWNEGDIALWDNRCVLHRGHPWPFEERRVMRRTTIAGEGENPWAMEDSEEAASIS